jgi:SAM-dependent methyltransferase
MKYSGNGDGRHKTVIASPKGTKQSQRSLRPRHNSLAGPRDDAAERFEVEAIVKRRYAEVARKKEKNLCRPGSYDPKFLKAIPSEVIDKDYGCGDPSRYLREGDAVLDLGSGSGKICYIASQIVGPKGRVLGIDFNPEMLGLARKYQKGIEERIGWSNVKFYRARIQDLRTDLDALEAALQKEPVRSADDFLTVKEALEKRGAGAPMIRDESIDVIVSNCVLNLVRTEDKLELFREMHRVLKKGGRVAIADMVADEPIPEGLQKDPELWSGCISGAFQEQEFLTAFEDSGFYGIKIEAFDELPWRTVRGIEFRSVTVTATKGKEGPCWERNQAVIYKGPWKQVEDDDHHILKRGARTAVCDKTFQIFSKAPYQDDLILVQPEKVVPLSKAKPFDCSRNPARDPRETKGSRYRKTTPVASACLDGGCC